MVQFGVDVYVAGHTYAGARRVWGLLGARRVAHRAAGWRACVRCPPRPLAPRHHYEREWPVQCESATEFDYINPTSPVHVLSGKAGINGQDEFKDEDDSWNAFRDLTYTMSFGRITIHNETHLSFAQHRALDGSVLDSFTLVQENHGPFPVRECRKRL